MNRREVIQAMLAALGAAAIPGSIQANPEPKTRLLFDGEPIAPVTSIGEAPPEPLRWVEWNQIDPPAFQLRDVYTFRLQEGDIPYEGTLRVVSIEKLGGSWRVRAETIDPAIYQT